MIHAAVADSYPLFVAGIVGTLTNAGIRATTVDLLDIRSLAARPHVFVIGHVQGKVEEMAILVGKASRIAPVLLVMECGGNGMARHPQWSVRGVLDRSAGPTALVAAVRTIAAGRRFSDAVPGPGAGELSRSDHQLGRLSPREQQVLGLIADGLTHGQIAYRLDISQHTVDTHIKRIKAKLGVGTKAGLTRAAIAGNGHNGPSR